MAGPGDKAGRGRMRASHADRDQVVDALKAAFVQGRLTQDELEDRVGQAFAARTYADLAALTDDLPAEKAGPPAEVPSAAAPQPRQPAPAPTRVHPSIKTGACVLGTVAAAFMAWAVSHGAGPKAVALLIVAVIFTVIVSAIVAAPIAVVLKLEARRRSRSGGQLPPRRGPGEGELAPRHEAPWPGTAAGPLPPVGSRHPPTAEAVRPGAVRPGAARPGAARRKNTRSKAARPGAPRPGAARRYAIACAGR